MSVPFMVCNLDGVILRTGDCPEEMVSLQAQKDQFALIGWASDALHYVDTTQLSRMDKHPVTATLTGLAFSGLPVPCQLTIEGVTYEHDEDAINLAFTYPGTYTVRVSALHYIARDYEVTV